MTTVLDIEHQLDDEIVVRDHFVGDIRCKKLTITRTGSVKGNILCKHLQVGGYVEGIAVCHVLEGNTQGTLHGSLYYVIKKDEAKVAGIVDYREPPLSIWAVVMPDLINAPPLPSIDEFEVSTAEALTGTVETLVDESVTHTAVDASVAIDVVVTSDRTEAGILATDDERGLSVTSVPASHPVEVIGTSSKFFPTSDESMEALQKPVAAAPVSAWVSTGRKVPLNARFF